MSKKPMTFKEYKKLNLTQISDEILSYWEDNDIFRKSIEKSNDKNPFIFYCLNFFHIFSLFRYKRPFDTINRCWDPSRMIENDLELHPVLLSHFFER